MKAIVKTSHAPGAAYRDAEVPVINKDELLIRVTSASLSSGDLAAYNWTDPLFPAHRLPFVFGQEFCGEVVETGSLARGFEKGDFVSVESHIFCGVCGQCRNDQRHICQYLRVIGRDTPGGLAEYAAVPARCAWKHTDDSLKDIGALMGAFGSSVHAVLAEDIVGRSIVVSGCAPQGLFAAGILPKTARFAATASFSVPYKQNKLGPLPETIAFSSNSCAKPFKIPSKLLLLYLLAASRSLYRIDSMFL